MREAPAGFGPAVDQPSQEMLKQITKLLDRIGVGEISSAGRSSDISPLMRGGVPGLAERTVCTRYFDWHYTETDALDKSIPNTSARTSPPSQ